MWTTCGRRRSLINWIFRRPPPRGCSSAAQDEQIVRIGLSAPVGIHADLERQLESIYGLKEALVVESLRDEKQILATSVRRPPTI